MSAEPVGQGLGLPTLVHTIAEPVESRLVGLAERYLIPIKTRRPETNGPEV